MGIFGRRRSRGTPTTSPQTSYRHLDAKQPPKGSPQAATQPGAACRICLSDEGPLITPCACRGDSAHVHVACLARWARAKEPRVDAWRRCGVCLTTYSGAGAVALADRTRSRRARGAVPSVAGPAPTPRPAAVGPPTPSCAEVTPPRHRCGQKPIRGPLSKRETIYSPRPASVETP